MKFKPNVKLKISRFSYALEIIDDCFKHVVGHESLMTSANDSKHSKNSRHYADEAWDFRTRQDNSLRKPLHDKKVLLKLTERIQDFLGAGFFVLMEDDHIHVQYGHKNIKQAATE